MTARSLCGASLMYSQLAAFSYMASWNIRKKLLSLSAEPSMGPSMGLLPVREDSRIGLNRSTPKSMRSPTNTIAAGLVAPPNASTAIAVPAPARPLALMP